MRADNRGVRFFLLPVLVAVAMLPSGGSKPAPAPGLAPDATLKRQILRENPRLGEDLRTNRYRAAQTILRWAAPRIPWQAAEDEAARFNFGALSAGETWERFRSMRGVRCGDASDFLAKTLRLFGFPSTTLDYGRLGFFTHVTALAYVPDTGWVMLDPTFNLELVDREGAPLSLVRALRGAEVRGRAGDLSRRWYVADKRHRRRCAGLGRPGCGLRHLRLAGYRGVDGLLRLMRERTFSPDIPADVRAAL